MHTILSRQRTASQRATYQCLSKGDLGAVVSHAVEYGRGVRIVVDVVTADASGYSAAGRVGRALGVDQAVPVSIADSWCAVGRDADVRAARPEVDRDLIDVSQRSAPAVRMVGLGRLALPAEGCEHEQCYEERPGVSQ